MIFQIIIQIIVCIQIVVSKLYIVKKELQGNFLDSDPDIADWTFTGGQVVSQKTLDCHVDTLNVKYMGPFGAASSSSTTMTLSKTYSNIDVPHWSLGYDFELLFLGYYANDKALIKFDSNTIQQLNWDAEVYHGYFQQQTQDICDYASGYYYDYGQYFKPGYNITHNSNSLDFEIEFTTVNDIDYASLAISNVYLYVDTCHESCLTCSGPSENQCTSCPTNSQSINGLCVCDTNYYQKEWTCVLSCPSGFTLVDQICKEDCPEPNCSSCTNFICTACDSPYYIFRGNCIKKCPFYSNTVGSECIDNMKGVYNDTLAYYYDDFLSNDYTNYEFYSKGWQFSQSFYVDGVTGDTYRQPGLVGLQCQDRSLLGGFGTVLLSACTGGTSDTCLYSKYYNLPPHYKVKIRYQMYILDEWSNGYYNHILNGVTEQVSSVTNSGPNTCGFNRGYPDDSVIDYTKEIDHSDPVLQLGLLYYSDQYTIEQTAAYGDISLYVAGCDIRCSACDSATVCTSCIGDSGQSYSRQVGSLCSCPSGYLDQADEGIENCILCFIDYCQACPVDRNVCTDCKGGDTRLEPDCSCIQGYYNDDNFDECLPCFGQVNNRCVSCENDPSNFCDSCVSVNRDPLKKCACNDGYYDNNNPLETECFECDTDCLTCENANSCLVSCHIKCIGCQNNYDECIACRENRYFSSNDCICNAGYYEVGLEECQECHVSCDGCDPITGNCLACKPTRILGGDDPQQCICDQLYNGIPDQVSPQRTYMCTTCEIAVTNNYFSDDLTILIVEFPVEIFIQKFDNPTIDLYQEEYSYQLCEFIFEQATLDILTQGIYCKVNPDDKSQILINLSTSSQILVGDEIEIIPNTIIRNDISCNQIKFNTFYGKEVRQPGILEQPSVQIKEPKGLAQPCFDTNLSFQKLFIDGKRGFQNIQWSLFNTTNSNTDFGSIFTDATNNNQNFLTIPGLTMDEYEIYFIQVRFENFIGVTASQLIKIESSSKEGIYNEIIETSPFVLKNYQVNYFEATMRYLDCRSGTIEEKDIALETKWEVIESDNTEHVVQEQISQPTQKLSQYQMQKYSFEAGETYTIKFTIKIPDQDLIPESATQTTFEIENTKLFTLIEGGNRSNGYDQALKIKGIGKNLDIPVDQQSVGIQYQWSCIFLTDSTKSCQTIDQVDFNLHLETGNSLEFQAKSLQPYTSFLFQLNTEDTINNSQDGSSQATIMIVETNLPLLTVSLPDNIISSVINKNDDLQVDVTYGGNPDELFYSLTLFYKFNVVATKNFQFSSYQFRIWDLFDQFDTFDNQIIIRVSLYDPTYFMPSQSSFTLSINIPPRNGSLGITSTTALMLDDIFKIEAQNFFDEQLPLTYQYHIYTNENAYLEDREAGNSPINFKKHVIQPKTSLNQYLTILPLGDYNPDTSKYELLVMVSVLDSQDGIFNSTQVIETVPQASMDILSQIQLVQNIYDNIITQPQHNWFSTLNILAIHISRIDTFDYQNTCNGNGAYLTQESICKCNDDYYLRDCSANESQLQSLLEIKKAIYDSIESIKSSITDLTMIDQAIKCQKLLLQDNLLGLLLDNNDFQSSLDNLRTVINNKSNELTSIVQSNLQNTGDSKITQRQGAAQGTLGSSLGVIDSLQKNLNFATQNPILKRRLLQSDLNDQEINQNLVEIVSLQKDISKSLQEVILPNSDEINYSGESLYTSIAKSTDKRMQESFFTEQQLLEGFKSTENKLNEQNNDGEENEENYQIYRTSRSIQEQNPYRKNEQYPYPDQITELQDVDIFTETDGEQSLQEIAIQNSINMQFSNFKVIKDNLQCIQKEDDLFSGKNCQKQEIEDDEGDVQQVCKCTKINPTTLIDDIDNIFSQSNIDDVFTDEGFNALSGFEFWKSLIFYAFLTFQLLFIYSLYLGNKLDKRDTIKFQKIQPSLINDLENKSIVNTEIEEIQSPQGIVLNNNNDNNNLNDEQLAQMNAEQQDQNENLYVKNMNSPYQEDNQNENLKVSSNKRKSQRRKNKNQTQNQQQDNNSNSNDINNLERKNSLNSQNSRRNSLKQSNIQLSQYQLQDNSKQMLNTNETIKKKDMEEIRKQEIESKLVKKPQVIQFIPSVHELFSIAYIYDEKISRMARYTTIYVKNCIILAVSGTISSELGVYYTIIWSLVGTLAANIPGALISVLFSKNKITKGIATFLSVCIIAVSYYIGIVNAAIIGVDESNNWAIAYLSTLLFDQFGIQIFIGYLQLKFFNFSIGLEGKGQQIRKILGFNSQIQEQFT